MAQEEAVSAQLQLGSEMHFTPSWCFSQLPWVDCAVWPASTVARVLLLQEDAISEAAADVAELRADSSASAHARLRALLARQFEAASNGDGSCSDMLRCAAPRMGRLSN